MVFGFGWMRHITSEVCCQCSLTTANGCFHLDSHFSKTALLRTRPVRRRTGWWQTVPTSSQRTNGHQIHPTSTNLTTICGAQCFRHFTGS